MPISNASCLVSPLSSEVSSVRGDGEHLLLSDLFASLFFAWLERVKRIGKAAAVLEALPHGAASFYFMRRWGADIVPAFGF